VPGQKTGNRGRKPVSQYNVNTSLNFSIPTNIAFMKTGKGKKVFYLLSGIFLKVLLFPGKI